MYKSQTRLSCEMRTDAQADEAMRPVPLNVHRLMLTGVLLAAKLMDDHYYNNAYYAKVLNETPHAVLQIVQPPTECVPGPELKHGSMYSSYNAPAWPAALLRQLCILAAHTGSHLYGVLITRTRPADRRRGVGSA